MESPAEMRRGGRQISTYVYIFRFNFVLFATRTGRLIPGMKTPRSSCNGHETRVSLPPQTSSSTSEKVFTSIPYLRNRDFHDEHAIIPSPDLLYFRGRCLSVKCKKCTLLVHNWSGFDSGNFANCRTNSGLTFPENNWRKMRFISSTWREYRVSCEILLNFTVFSNNKETDYQ